MDGSFEPTISPARRRAQARQLEHQAGTEIHVTKIKDLRRTPVTVRSDFVMPIGKVCCGKPMTPTAYNDCGEIYCFFMCDECDDQDGNIPWPFSQDRAWGEDIERIGFRYEY